MPPYLVKDVLLLIFTELQPYPAALYSCILVNKDWCDVAIRILWNCISYDDNPFAHTQRSRVILYNTIAHFLPNGPEEILRKNNIILPLNQFSRLSFNYMEFITRITSIWIVDMIEFLIKEGSDFSDYKKTLLETEIYKLIFNECKNIEYFNWITDIQLYLCPKADEFFSNLRSIEFNIEFMSSVILLCLPTVCNNITDLKINLYKEDSSNLVTFIKMQRNLQSLYLQFDNEDEHYTLLSEVIMEKAATLKHITLTPHISLITPTFFPALINLQHLELINDNGELNDVDWKEWVNNLSISSFPMLQYLETAYLPSSIESLVIEKAGGNLLEINIRNSLEFLNYQIENKKLIQVISECPKITRLAMDVHPNLNNLNEISSILSNCSQLEKIHFSTKDRILPNGDGLLRIMSNISSPKLREFSFGDNWNFSLDGLKSFFECWEHEKRSIKFTHLNDGLNFSWSGDHDRLIEKYNRAIK